MICTDSFAEIKFQPCRDGSREEKDNRHVTTFGPDEEFVCGCERLRLPTSGADQQLDPTHAKVSINTSSNTPVFFSYV